MKNKLCASCGKAFQPRPQTPHQTYCSEPRCQRERRNKWQESTLATDQDYRDNQLRAQQAWRARNPDYPRLYRESHPEYVSDNRLRQGERNAAAASKKIAKMDASNPLSRLLSGIYKLRLVSPGEIVKMDVCTVEITPHDCHCSQRKIAKRGRDR